MRKYLSIVPMIVVAGAAMIGCGSSEPQHTIRAPDPPSTYKIPTTKEEKIAAINRAPVSDEMKKAEIAKVNAGH